jgi:hypothetical protein
MVLLLLMDSTRAAISQRRTEQTYQPSPTPDK